MKHLLPTGARALLLIAAHALAVLVSSAPAQENLFSSVPQAPWDQPEGEQVRSMFDILLKRVREEPRPRAMFNPELDARLEPFLNKIDDLIARKQWDEAATEIGQILVGIPDHPGLLQRAGLVYVQRGKNLLAEDQWERLSVVEPDNPEHYLLRASLVLRDGRLTKAEALVGKALELDPNLPTARYLMGVALMAQRRAQDMRSCLRDLQLAETALFVHWLDTERDVLIDLMGPESFETLARYILRGGSLAYQSIRNHPTINPPPILTAIHREQETEKARRDPESLPLTEEQLSRAASALFDAYLALRSEKWEEAEVALEEAAYQGVVSPAIERDLAFCAFKLDRREYADELMSGLINQFPGRGDFPAVYAMMLNQWRKTPEAEDMLKRARRTLGDMVDMTVFQTACINLDYLLVYDGEDGEVTWPRDTLVYPEAFRLTLDEYLVSLTGMIEKENWHEAGNAVQLMLRLDPENSGLKIRAGQVLTQLGQFEESLTYWNQLTDTYPDDARFQACRGGVLLRMGRLSDAQTALELALRLSPDDQLVRYNCAFYYAARGDMDKANALLQSRNIAELGQTTAWIRGESDMLRTVLGDTRFAQVTASMLEGTNSATETDSPIGSYKMVERLSTVSDLLARAFRARQERNWDGVIAALKACRENGATAPVV
ncbi:MAG: tetratricopeptide repeat protein [Verrucomicrobia bacterium]|nr:tetratricopeptide repeat protein [Verrucomicrobiota bacterium]